jgi:4'-phosphopantetheinyl transferase EntD
MLGTEVVVEVGEPSLANHCLFPDELEYIAWAVDKRKAEFSTARACARRALSRLGVAPCSLVPNPDRSPRWPKGITGSITHTAGCCAVVLSNAPHLIGIGLDIEQDTPLPANLESIVCTERERAWLGQYDESERARWGKLYFSAKEAFYKCQYGTTRAVIDFLDVDIQFDITRQSFRIVALAGRGPAWDVVGQAKGRFRSVAGFVITTASLVAFDRLT